MIKVLTFFYNSVNYGGMLQAFALCHFLQRNHHQCEQICYVRKNSQNITLIEKLRKTTPNRILNKLKAFFGEFLFKTFVRHGKIRKENFKNFQNFCVPHTSVVFSEENISTSVNRDDVVIVGSDQVWNPFWTNNNYFLDFVPKDCKKIAYAASLGVAHLPNNAFFDKKELLDSFDLISVREKNAQQLLSPYTNNKIYYVADPTLLIERKEWDKICHAPSIKEPYIFAYFLGNNKSHKCLIKKIASLLGYKVAFIPHIHFLYNLDDLKISDFSIDESGPSEFIGLIKNAEMVLTDSFHGCVFSIIYHKRFWAFNRHSIDDEQDMSSRLQSLFSTLGLQDRYLKSLDINNLTVDYLQKPIDYDVIQSKCDKFTQFSSSILLNSLKK